jgi:hypothetical protein
MVRKIYVPHVDEYLQCPLLYRYHRELDLPYNKNTQNELLLKSAKRAIHSWFDALGKGLNRKKARRKVGQTLKWLWSKDGGNEQEFPLAHARIMESLLMLDNHFNQEHDSPLGGGINIDTAIDGTLFEDVIDGLYLKNDLKEGAKRFDKHFVAIQVIPNGGIVSPRVVQMRKAMIRYSLNTAMKPNPYKIKLLQITLPDATKAWYNLDKQAHDEFVYLARAVVRHLDSQHYLPTANPTMCTGCPYKTICTNHFCEPEVSSQLVGRARAKLNRQS